MCFALQSWFRSPQEAALSDTTEYLQTQQYSFSSWQCKCLISTGHNTRSQAPPALLLLDLAWGWLRAWLASCQGALLAQPQEMPICQKQGEGLTGLWSLLCWAMPTALYSCESRNPSTLSLIFFSSESSGNTQAWSLPTALCPAPTETAGGGAAGVCRSWRVGAHHLSGVHTQAAVFCGGWLRLTACKPSARGGECTHWGQWSNASLKYICAGE